MRSVFSFTTPPPTKTHTYSESTRLDLFEYLKIILWSIVVNEKFDLKLWCFSKLIELVERVRLLGRVNLPTSSRVNFFSFEWFWKIAKWKQDPHSHFSKILLLFLIFVFILKLLPIQKYHKINSSAIVTKIVWVKDFQNRLFTHTPSFFH